MSTLRTSCPSRICNSWRVVTPTMLGTSVALKVGGDLRVEVNTIHHNYDRRIAEFRMHPQLLRGEHHEQRLATALEMPDETFLRITLYHAVHDLVGSEILLVTANDLDATILFVR